jgi:hypothetical protein
VALLTVATLAAGALSACGSTAHTAAVTVLPLSASSSSGTTQWASLPMGILTQRVNTFWELFGRTGRRWVLATPPGIATNGGVLAAPGPGSSITSGVVPSFALGFSPVATSTAPGGSWTTGVLPAGLVRAPDALAVTPDGRRLALLSGSGAGLVSSSGGLSSWTTVATDAGISAATTPQGCDLASPSAVTVAQGGPILVGGHCTRGAQLPIAFLHGHTWRLAASANLMSILPGISGTSVQQSVLRLARTSSGAAALLEADVPQRRAIVLLSSRRGVAPWSEDATLVLPEDSTIVSTSLGEDGSATVVLSSSSGAQTADTLSAGSSRWATLPTLPDGTVDVVDGAPTQALAVDHSVLTVFDEQRGAWRVVQRLQVPIAYGSSG